jgi:hypothetical protein
LDGLVDQLFERYKDRFFVGEVVIVELPGEKCVAQTSWRFLLI